MAESRAHHFVPQCWLSGFTGTAADEGFLYVTDLKRRKQWRCKPSEAGHRRDYNRIENPGLNDPLAIEKAFANMESAVAPLLRSLANERRGVRDGDELGMLTEFMAFQAIRVPSFRAFLKRATMKLFREEVLKDKHTWEAALRRASLPLDSPGTDYSRAIEAIDGNHVFIVDDPAFHLKQGAMQLQAIDDAMKCRRWGQLVSRKGLFIGSDNRVVVDGDANQEIGFMNAPVVLFPATRFLLLYGALEDVQPDSPSIKEIARTNTFVMMTADEQVFSDRPNFYWLDAQGRCQTSWELFNREHFFPAKLGP